MHHPLATIAGGLAASGVLVGGLVGALTGRSAVPAPSGARGSVAHVRIVGNNRLRFSPMTVRVRSRTVEVTFVDSGAYPHNIVIPALHFTSPTVSGDPGATTARFTVHFPRSGRYSFHCAFHVASGMVGTFVVS